MTLLNVVILGHILYRPYYNDALVYVDQSKEALFKEGRKKASELLKFMANSYSFTLDGRPINFWDLFSTYFVKHARCLIKQSAMSFNRHENHTGLSPGCTPHSLTESIVATFHGKTWFLDEIQRQNRQGIHAVPPTYDFTSEYSEEVYVVFPRNAPSSAGVLANFWTLYFCLSITYPQRVSILNFQG